MDKKNEPDGQENEVTEIVGIIQNIPGDEGIEVEEIEQWMREDDPEFVCTDDELIELTEKNDKDKQLIESNNDKAPCVEIETLPFTKALKFFETIEMSKTVQ